MYSASQSVAKMRDAHLFHLTRARLQRTSDSKFFSGWMLDIKVDTASIRVNGDFSQVEVGDNFSVEVTGKEKTAVFLGRVVEIVEDVITLDLPRGAVTLPKKESARISLVGLSGRLNFDGMQARFALADISESGLGIVTGTEVARETPVDFELETPQGTIKGKGETRHCGQDADSPGHYRIGIEIKHIDRIERARWQRLLANVWEG